MERIEDAAMVKAYAERFRMDQFFSSDIQFTLLRYSPGETIVHPAKPFEYLQFIVEGEIFVYAIREDGSFYSLAEGKRKILLGDIRFITGRQPDLYAEAKSEVVAISVSVRAYGKQLAHDSRFLRHLAWTLAEEFRLAIVYEARYISLADKLIHYIRYSSDEGFLTHVGQAALALHVSQRQLQRVLRQMTEEGKLERLGKGRYRLNGGNVGN